MADEGRPQYQVTGALIYLMTATPHGPRLTEFKRNAFVPADVPQEQIDHHLSVGLIVPVDAPEAPAKARRGS